MKRLLLLVFALAIGISPSFSQKREVGKVKTVVIDPGHGGDKPGAIGKKSKEKDIVLSVAKKFGKLIEDNYPDVTIIYTHDTDVDVSLAERAHIANRNKADLFISIHANSCPSTSPTGVETFVMGLSQSKANMDVAKTENADILLESGYKNNSDYAGFDPNSPESYVMFAMYQNMFLDRSLDFAKMIQDQYKVNLHTIDRGVKQAELFVIYKTTMPSVLTEIGFISNSEEELFMMSDAGQAKIAVSLFQAFAKYKAKVENTTVPAKQVIDLPGYGKKAPNANKPNTNNDQALEDALSAVLDSDLSPAPTPAPTPKAEPDASKFNPNTNTVPVAEGRASTGPATQVPATPAMGDETELPAPVVNPNDMSIEQLSFRVQFLTSDKLLPEGDKAFKGLTGFQYYQQGNTYRYTMGNEPTINRAVIVQNEVRAKGFKDAFVVAFYKGQRISLQEAREMQQKQ